MNNTNDKQLREKLKAEIIIEEEAKQIKYLTSDNQQITLSMAIARKYLCNDAKDITNQELMVYMQICKFAKLNPFLRDVYLVKFGNMTPSIIVGKGHFLKVANRNKNFDGFRAGIIVEKDGEEIEKEGTIIRNGEILVGGWAEVYRKDRKLPFRNTVSLKEYMGLKKDGTPNRQWKRMPATMVRKVPLVQSLREAFPEDLSGLTDPSERDTIKNVNQAECEQVTNEEELATLVNGKNDKAEIDSETGEIYSNDAKETTKQEDNVDKLKEAFDAAEANEV